MNYNWNWGIFFQTSPDGVHTYLERLLLGTGWTLATALSAWCLALAMGTLVGVIRTTPNPWLVRLGTAYVELFRNVPLLVQMFLWYFVLPELLPTQAGDWLKQLPDASFYTAVVALGFYTSARVAEQVRAAKYFDGRFYRHNRRAGLWFRLMTGAHRRWPSAVVAITLIRTGPLISRDARRLQRPQGQMTISLARPRQGGNSQTRVGFSPHPANGARTTCSLIAALRAG